MNEFQEIRKKERFSENFGWLERNSKLVESLTSQCDNYIVLINKLKGNGFKGSYSSLLSYVTNDSKTYYPEQCCLEKKT